jgi:hypothetical protein
MHNEVIIGEAVAGQAASTRAQLESLINNVNKQTIDVAELLHKVKSNAFYQPLYNTFKDYISTLDIKERKAQYLVKIVEVMSAVGMTRTVYEHLGVAKLREITSLDPAGKWKNPETGEETPMQDFIIGFVEKGDEIDLADLKQHVRTLKGFTGENDLVWLNLCVTKSVLDNTIRPALELAKNMIGSVSKDDEGFSKDASDGAALEVLAIGYMTDPSNDVAPEVSTESEPE